MAPTFVEVYVEENPLCPEGCTLRFRAEGVARPVRAVRYPAGLGEIIVCDVQGWSSENGGSACPAHAIAVEDSSAGVATLVWGGDWGVRLLPRDGRPAFGEPYLLLSAHAVSDE